MNQAQIRQRLEAERARLTEMRDGILEQHGDGESGPAGAAELTTYDQHDADMATETFEREKDASIRTRLEAEMKEVSAALAKLDGGDYGVCEACGGPIGDDRLNAFPAARFCVDDQAAAEREAAVPGEGAP